MKKIKILKTINIVSILFITGLHTNPLPLFIVILIQGYDFISEIFTQPFLNIWEGLIIIPLIGTLVILTKCKIYKERYLFTACLFVIILFILNFIGIFNRENYYLISSLWFIIPIAIFIISSIFLLYLNFKKPKLQTK